MVYTLQLFIAAKYSRFASWLCFWMFDEVTALGKKACPQRTLKAKDRWSTAVPDLQPGYMIHHPICILHHHTCERHDLPLRGSVLPGQTPT